MTRTALVTGAGGQDGVLLARHLLAGGYRVVGTVQPGATAPMLPYLDGVQLEPHDLRDAAGLDRLLAAHEPDEVYNLAGFTSVGASWDAEELVHEVNTAAVESMLDSLLAMRDRTGAAPRFFQASSSEVFGPRAPNPQDESTPHAPASPYAVSKSRAQQATVRARQDHGLFACVGILYNHESPLRGAGFVTRKIVRAAVEISEGRRDAISLGNLDVSRDWGAARDYVTAMHLALGHDEPGDYVLATGVLRSLQDLLELAFGAVGIADPWPYVQQDPALMRKADAPGLSGDASRAREVLGWTAATSFEQLVAEMVEVELQRVRTGVEESAEYLRR
ncbi:GDP-mannose 4,6-dehydratase [Aeromicrobium sp. NPDC092404]|uniref:GDP-mannose 4,6-dehydratase n=1 Tax=Aeromicrobium sp. NPDC092404 TaxID=3154976 RepID=UPI003424C023